MDVPDRRAEGARVARPALAGLLLALLSTATAARSSSPARVLLLAPNDDDARIELTRSAIDHWNTTFAELSLDPAFGELEIVAAPADRRSFENYAWQISRSAGRLGSGPSSPLGSSGPPAPEALESLDADVVILLSEQKLMPFAWPWREGSHFVGLPADDGQDPSELRNVVAHELGHVLGLAHDRSSPEGLMCQPCAAETGTSLDGFRPLTSTERERLRELHTTGH